MHCTRSSAARDRGLLAILITLVAATAAVGQPQGIPPARVVLDPVRLETLEQMREATGEVRARRVALLAAQEQGLVVEASFEAGDPVEAGDLLIELDARLVELDVEQAEADTVIQEDLIAQAEAEHAKAVRDLARARNLAERSVATETQVQDAETDELTSRARVEQRRAELAAARVRIERARERLARMSVKVPFSGVITAKSTEVGQWLRPGDVVAELSDLSSVEVWLDVPESILPRIEREKTVVQLEIPAVELKIDASIERIVPRGDRLSRLFPVRIVLDNAERRLRPGMSVLGRLPSGVSDPVLTVAKDAILRDDGGAFLYYDAGGAAAVARIETLYAVGDRMVVRSGRLTAGVGVVVEGNERVFPGQPLMVMGAPATGESAGEGEGAGGDR